MTKWSTWKKRELSGLYGLELRLSGKSLIGRVRNFAAWISYLLMIRYELRYLLLIYSRYNHKLYFSQFIWWVALCFHMQKSRIHAFMSAKIFELFRMLWKKVAFTPWQIFMYELMALRTTIDLSGLQSMHIYFANHTCLQLETENFTKIPPYGFDIFSLSSLMVFLCFGRQRWFSSLYSTLVWKYGFATPILVVPYIQDKPKFNHS